jgi:hypothetical protein
MAAVPSMQVKVEGGARLRRTLKQADDGIDDLKAAHELVARIIIGAAQGTVPRRSGALASSMRPAKQQRRAIIMAGGGRGKDKVRYAGPIHWGWPARNITPQPWIIEAGQRSQAQWVDAYAREIDKILSKVEGA